MSSLNIPAFNSYLENKWYDRTWDFYKFIYPNATKFIIKIKRSKTKLLI